MARQRSAKPRTSVRIRLAPQKNPFYHGKGFFISNATNKDHMIPQGINQEAYYKLFTEEFLSSREETAFDKYTRLNIKRSERWFKRLKLEEEVETYFGSINTAEKWVIISEPWCGDASHSLPVIQQLADCNPRIETTYVLRDENKEYMNQFLTNGGMSIPIINVYNAQNELQFSWGPRPSKLQALFLSNKEKGISKDESTFQLQTWYNKDKGQSTVAEFTAKHKKSRM